jgi:hypothetical protein
MSQEFTVTGRSVELGDRPLAGVTVLAYDKDLPSFRRGERTTVDVYVEAR